MSCLPPVKGIPYDFNGSLSLESRYIILAQYVCKLSKDIDENLRTWIAQWVTENIDNIFGNIMFNEDSGNLSFSIENIVRNAEHSYSNDSLIIKEVK